MASKSAAAASEAHVAQTSREVLARGNAVDAVLAGLLVAAAENAAVWLGPVQVLVAGGGAGLRAVDGRVRQPGLGGVRPRGHRPGEPVPPSALVGVPAMPATIALVRASLGSIGLTKLAAPAIERAQARSPERARVLEAFAQRGPVVMGQDEIAGELSAAAGRAAGGSLTQLDLASVRPAIVSCDERSLEPAGVLMAPWRERAAAVACDASRTHVVVAADARGLVAAAVYEAGVDVPGLSVPALGLMAPPAAVLVRRGEPRLRPGSPCAAAAPVAIYAPRAVPQVGLGVAASADAEASLERIAAELRTALTVAAALSVASSGTPVAVAVGETARVIASCG